MFPPAQGVPGSSFLDAEFEIDPAVGGITANTTVFNFPTTSGDIGIQTGGIAQDSSSFFLPGIYTIRAEIRSAGNITGRKGLVFNFLSADPAFPRFPWGGVGGGILIKAPLYLQGGAGAQTLAWQHRLYFPIAWFIRVDTGTVAWVDLDVVNGHCSVDNEYILDEPGSMSF